MPRDAVIEQSVAAKNVSDEVVSAVAAEKGVDPMELTPLYEVVDPDALDAIYRSDGFGRAGPPVRVEFTYSGCDVVIDGDASVTVSDAR